MKFIDWSGQERELPEGKSFSWRPSVYALVLNEGKLLCVQSNFNKLWELPGGAMELGETPTQSLIREVFEETGYNITLKDEIPAKIKNNFFYAPNTDKYSQAICMVFYAELNGTRQNPSIKDSKEIANLKWIPLSRLLGYKFNYLVQNIIDEGILKEKN